MRIVFIGAPGAGKGTQSERLVVALGIKHLSTGEMLRQAMTEKTPLGRMAEQFISAGRLVPDRLIIDLIRERLQNPDCSNGFLLDGFPRTLGQAEGLDAFLTDNGTPLDLVLELRVDEDELLRRLLGRGRAAPNESNQEQVQATFRSHGGASSSGSPSITPRHSIDRIDRAG